MSANAPVSGLGIFDDPAHTPTIHFAYDNHLEPGYFGDGDSTYDCTPTVTGSAPAGSPVLVFDHGALLGSAIADTSGGWAFSTELTVGEHALVVLACGETSAPFCFEVLAPGLISPAFTQVFEDAGAFQASTGVATTEYCAPTLQGIAEPWEVVELFADGAWHASTMSDLHGNWRFTPALSEGPHALAVKVDELFSEAININIVGTRLPLDALLIAPEDALLQLNAGDQCNPTLMHDSSSAPARYGSASNPLDLFLPQDVPALPD